MRRRSEWTGWDCRAHRRMRLEAVDDLLATTRFCSTSTTAGESGLCVHDEGEKGGGSS